MENVESIQFVLGNTVKIKVDGEHIGLYSILDVRRNVVRIESNGISDYVSPHHIFLHISRKANQQDVNENNYSGADSAPFDKIINGDKITAIHVFYRDGREDCISIDANIDSTKGKRYYQTAEINKLSGDLYILIREKENLNLKHF